MAVMTEPTEPSEPSVDAVFIGPIVVGDDGVIRPPVVPAPVPVVDVPDPGSSAAPTAPETSGGQ